MYDHLVGEVIEKQTARAVLRVQGIGYECKVSLTTAGALTVGQTQQLYTILHVVDGMPTLLGFASRSERELCRKILSVSGVGPTTALSILSVYSPQELVAILQQNDAVALRKVKGVGQKTSERLCLELRDAVLKLDLEPVRGERAVVVPNQAQVDAIAALITLGYSEKEAKEKVEKARGRGAEATTEALVRAVLQM